MLDVVEEFEQWPNSLEVEANDVPSKLAKVAAETSAAARLGEKCIDLQCEEMVGVLDVVEEFEQWPNSLEAEANDVPSELAKVAAETSAVW